MENYKELIASTVEKNRQKYIDHLLKRVMESKADWKEQDRSI